MLRYKIHLIEESDSFVCIYRQYLCHMYVRTASINKEEEEEKKKKKSLVPFLNFFEILHSFVP